MIGPSHKRAFRRGSLAQRLMGLRLGLFCGPLAYMMDSRFSKRGPVVGAVGYHKRDHRDAGMVEGVGSVARLSAVTILRRIDGLSEQDFWFIAAFRSG